MNTRSNKFLSVYPNPYFNLDAFGNPAGIVPCDPEGHTPDRRWVGAFIQRTEILDKFDTGDLRGPRQDTYFDFEVKTPTLIPDTHYYRECLRSRSLFPADQETATRVGVVYKPKDQFFGEAVAEARANWVCSYGVECPLAKYVTDEEIDTRIKKSVDSK